MEQITQDPLPKVNENELEKFVENHEGEYTLYTVHSLSKPIKDGREARHDSWMVLKETLEDGEQDVRQYENNGRQDDRPKAKELAKNKARELARENKPAIVAIQRRDFEVHRVEVAE